MNIKRTLFTGILMCILWGCSEAPAPPPPPPASVPGLADHLAGGTTAAGSGGSSTVAKTGTSTGSSAATKNGDDEPVEPLPEWPKPADRDVMDLSMSVTDQDGRSLKIDDLTGKATVASFIFTRCANPQMCPLIVMRMAYLQREAKKRGMGDDVQFLLISYDPKFDTPKRLKAYGADRGLEFTNAYMLRPKLADLGDLFSEFQLNVAFNDNGTIANHLMELYVLDQQGRHVRWYRGKWNDQMVLGDLKRLVDEKDRGSKPETSKPETSKPDTSKPAVPEADEPKTAAPDPGTSNPDVDKPK